ncbi:MAG TPA: serine protease [Microvirga sp.]|jgi:hypothetical protein|nr:serine protease [Microvirga sp.]
MRPRVPEPTEEAAARLAEQVKRLGTRAGAAVEGAGAGLPSPAELTALIEARLRSAVAHDELAKPLASQTAREGHRIALEVAEGGRRFDDLSSADLANLEAVISVVGRPSWLVQNGFPLYDAPTREDEVWITRSASVRREIREACGRVGCIVLQDDERRPIGTGWLLSPRRLVTNAHVASRIFRRRLQFPPTDPHDGWRLPPGIEAFVDFCFERDQQAGLPFKLGMPLFIEPDPEHQPDIAVIEVEQVGGGLLLPSHIEIKEAFAPPQPGVDYDVLTIGHPIKDEANDPNVPLVFGALDGTKRLSPGRVIRALDSRTVAHDCSTTNGSSGSPLLDFASLKAIGLHYWGQPGKRNEAVILGAISDHPAIRRGLAQEG